MGTLEPSRLAELLLSGFAFPVVMMLVLLWLLLCRQCITPPPKLYMLEVELNEEEADMSVELVVVVVVAVGAFLQATPLLLLLLILLVLLSDEATLFEFCPDELQFVALVKLIGSVALNDEDEDDEWGLLSPLLGFLIIAPPVSEATMLIGWVVAVLLLLLLDDESTCCSGSRFITLLFIGMHSVVGGDGICCRCCD